MRRIDRPNFDSIEIYDACVSGITSPELSYSFVNARSEVTSRFHEYDALARAHRLFSFAPSAFGNDAQQVLAHISKKDFVDLYSKYMVGDGKPGRVYYDRLMMLAPLGKCPFCGFGHVSTLDHFLSKSRYPAFSVLSSNLIPSCSDCNKGKGASEVRQESQMLHPYFEESILDNETWLFAEVVNSTPPTVRYFVAPPDNWPEDLKQRINNHFSGLSLGRRFAVEAAAEISGLRLMLGELETQEMRQEHLSLMARVERRLLRNTWRAALYEALARSTWFLTEGVPLAEPISPLCDCNLPECDWCLQSRIDLEEEEFMTDIFIHLEAMEEREFQRQIDGD